MPKNKEIDVRTEEKKPFDMLQESAGIILPDKCEKDIEVIQLPQSVLVEVVERGLNVLRFGGNAKVQTVTIDHRIGGVAVVSYRYKMKSDKHV